ncbi:hypothetical protein FNV43_RR16746 [Rhamnella rubrinervis]|uniref:Uncharacterized protein n=1 Tax=Rhamnella rubrinervis TaxID=2594499 RepID=A0A8K0GZF9_9ROSA|nr:hypothetical protein FNV43_RR16746 [Rhamnella rubrinervis]
MSQWFSCASYSIREGRDTSVVEPVAIRTTTSRRESSSASYTGRRSHRGSIPSISGGGYRNVGLEDDSARQELEGQRQEFDEDPTEAMRAYIRARGFGGPPVAVAVLTEDFKDPEEEESMGSDDHVP